MNPRRWIEVALVGSVIACFAACGSGSGAPTASDEGGDDTTGVVDTTGGGPTGNTGEPDSTGGTPGNAVTSCTKNSTLRLGDFALLNNMHGEARLAPGDKYEQCVSIAKDGFPASWRWDLDTDQPYVKGFPQIYFGTHLWTKVSTTDLLPARIADIDTLLVRHDVALKVDGTYNLAFDLWILSGPDPAPDNRTGEIMIWLEGNMPPGGDANSRVTIDGAEYDFYRWTHDAGHAFLMFIARSPRASGTTDIRAFLDHLIASGDVDEDHYLANVELGDEMWNGHGTATITDFDVTLRTH